jgi:SAM-dependent methyltransferase
MLSERYDDIFPLNQAALGLIVSETPKGGSVLDVGCATGAYVEELHSLGYKAFGIEYEPMLMKYKNNVYQGDMHDIKLDMKFDTVMCTGNTLVHTESYDSLCGILKQFISVLNEGGKAVVQILNYDFIISKGIDQLPDIVSDSLFFERFYSFQNGMVDFKGRLTVDGNTEESSVKLYPVRSSELVAAAREAGFSSVELYGDFKKNRFDTEAGLPLVAVMTA